MLPGMDAGAHTHSAGVARQLERIEGELHAATVARPQDPTRLAGALEAAVDAVRRWPRQAGAVLVLAELAEAWGARDHGEDCRRTQQHLLRFTEAQRPEAVSGSAWLVPIRLEPFRGWCARKRRDPAAADARAGYAAERARTPDAVDEVIVWPPARNARCWCGSGRKYKQCCGHRSVTASAS